MNNIQINGQRRWGPPDDWSGPPPPHGTEIFIKNLPEDVLEQEIYAIFSKTGTVYEVRLPVNWNGLNRGYAFLRFTSLRATDIAIARFDGYEIRSNRKIKVTRSIDNTRLFLSSVPIEKNGEELKRDLLNHVDNVKKVFVYPTLENRFVFRGYAFVEFETHRDAAIAKRILTPDICYGIFEKKCIVAWANPLPFLDQNMVKSLNVLFMRNIPTDLKSSSLKKIIEGLFGGEIKRIKKLNDIAFLTFKDHITAENALNHLQNLPSLIPEYNVQVEWAVPKDFATSSIEPIGGERNKLNHSQICSEKIIPRCVNNQTISNQKLNAIPCSYLNDCKEGCKTKRKGSMGYYSWHSSTDSFKSDAISEQADSVEELFGLEAVSPPFSCPMSTSPSKNITRFEFLSPNTNHLEAYKTSNCRNVEDIQQVETMNHEKKSVPFSSVSVWTNKNRLSIRGNSGRLECLNRASVRGESIESVEGYGIHQSHSPIGDCHTRDYEDSLYYLDLPEMSPYSNSLSKPKNTLIEAMLDQFHENNYNLPGKLNVFK